MSLQKQKEKHMEAHKAKMNALSQELEELQLQLQALGPQKLRGSTASLTTSSVAAEDVTENVSDSSETKENSNEHQDEENKAEEIPSQEGEENETEESPGQHQEENKTEKQNEHKEENETKVSDPEVSNELTT